LCIFPHCESKIKHKTNLLNHIKTIHKQRGEELTPDGNVVQKFSPPTRKRRSSSRITLNDYDGETLECGHIGCDVKFKSKKSNGTSNKSSLGKHQKLYSNHKEHLKKVGKECHLCKKYVETGIWEIEALDEESKSEESKSEKSVDDSDYTSKKENGKKRKPSRSPERPFKEIKKQRVENKKDKYHDEEILPILKTILIDYFQIEPNSTDKETLENQIKSQIKKSNPSITDIFLENLILKYKLLNLENSIKEINEMVGALQVALTENNTTNITRRTRSHLKR